MVRKILLMLCVMFVIGANAQQITYTPQTANGYQFKYLKVDSLFHLSIGDTSLKRGVARAGAIVFRNADSLYYGYNGVRWVLLGGDISGLIPLINSKVDSVVFRNDTICSWKNNVKECYKIGGYTDTLYNLTPTAATVTVGGINSGYTLTGKTWQQLIKQLVAPYINPVFTSFSVSGQATTVEVGTTLSGSKTFTWAITNNSGTVNYINVYDITASGDIATNIANDGSEAITINTIQLNSNGATQQLRGVGLDASNGNATFNSSTFVVTARFYRFFGAAASIPTNSSEVRALPSSSFRIGSGTITLNTGTTYKKFYVALPGGVTITSVIDQTALNADITSSYVLTGTISVDDAGGTARTYNLYEMEIGTPYGENHAHIITHN